MLTQNFNIAAPHISRFLIKAKYFLIRGKTWLDRNKEIEINLLVLSLSGVLLFGDNHNFGLVLGWN